MTADAAHSGRPTSTARWLTLAMGVALAALGLWNWILRPDEPVRWLRGMLFVPAVWSGMALYRRLVFRSLADRGQIDRAAVRRYADSAMLVAFAGGCPMLVGYGLAVWTSYFGSPGTELGRRMLAFSAGAMFIVVGNMVPKILTPLFLLPPGRAGRQQEARRFLGLVLVLAGLTVAAASIVAPLELALTVLRTSYVVWMVTTVAAVVWMNTASSQPEGQS